MRREKQIKIDDNIYHVYEIRPKDLINIYSKAKEDGEVRKTLVDDLLPLLSDIPFSDLENMFPSEIEIAYDGLKEVNSSFFERLKGLAQHPEVKKILNELSATMLSEFGETFASSFKLDI